MTVINLETFEAALGVPGEQPVSSTLTLTPYTGSGDGTRSEGEKLVLPQDIVVHFTNGVPDEVLEVLPTTNGWCYEATLEATSPYRKYTRLISVPDQPSVDWEDLPDVDPETLEPLSPLPPSVQDLLDQVAEDAGEIAASAVEVAIARDLAEQAASRAEAVGATNDAISSTLVKTPSTATAIAVQSVVAEGMPGEDFGYQKLPLNDPTPFMHRPMFFKADSSGVPDGSVDNPTEVVYPTLVAGMLQASSFRNDHVGGSTYTDMILRMIDSGHTQYHGLTDALAIYNLFVGSNDAIFGGLLPSNQTQRGQIEYALGVETVIGILWGKENLHNWTKTGTWITIPDGPFSNNRTAPYTSTKGSKISQSFVVGAGKGITVVLLAPTDSVPGANYIARIDGVQVQGDSTREKTFGGDNTPLHAAFGPVPITYRNPNWVVGSTHIVEIEHNDDAGGALIVNSLHSWDIAPDIRITHVAYQNPEVWTMYNPVSPANNDIVDSYFRPKLNQVIGYFNNPKIKAYRPELLDQLFSRLKVGIRVADKLHPNREGHRRLARVVYENIVGLLTTIDVGDYKYVTESELTELVPSGLPQTLQDITELAQTKTTMDEVSTAFGPILQGFNATLTNDVVMKPELESFRSEVGGRFADLTTIMFLNVGEPVPANTPPGTLIARPAS